jgi:cardiolipin synthase A/B
MQFQLLVGADAFWSALEKDLAAARRRVLVQAMTFEADHAGSTVAAAIRASSAADRRVLIDHFSTFKISDRFVHGPTACRDPALRREISETRHLFSRFAAAGVRLRITNPAGPLLLGIAARNHKKLVVADDVAYIGGINFSDHNFAWHDLMLRIDDPGVAGFLSDDFDATFSGRSRSASADFEDLRMISLNGCSNPAGFQDVIDLIAAARRRIHVVSAYLTFPFIGVLAGAVERGVAVELFTPRDNNKRLVRDYLLDAARRAGIQVLLGGPMAHLKGMLIDGRVTIVGSTNFDFVSYHCEEELIAICRDRGLAQAFLQQVIAPARAARLPDNACRPSWLRVAFARSLLTIAAGAARLSRHYPRGAIEWAA